ncbi:C40 family peptidase [Paenibacillus sp. SYP-B4298]|uniref:C40 family peptidase n=1 Tax=Paenibacillus sp. SYP-B4298 TaxID=2996034 RepID=UPI0022DE41BF|nr:C40 family peptidase [Paenibacillus sp. SYP-B4298]
MRRIVSIIICIMVAWQVAGCGTQTQERGPKPSRVEKFSGEQHIAKLDEGQSPVPIVKLDGASYADIGRMAGQIGFQTRWTDNGNKLLIGDHDVVWSIQAESKTASVEGKSIVLDAPARKQQDAMLVTTATIERLFKDEAVFQVGETEITIFPVPGYIDPGASQAADFKDDPLDPAVRPAQEQGGGTSSKATPTNPTNPTSPANPNPSASPAVSMNSTEQIPQENRSNVSNAQDIGSVQRTPGDAHESAGLQGDNSLSVAGDSRALPAAMTALNASGTKVIDSAEKYMGVPYLFGTGPYSETKRFDCSSFVQYIYDKFDLSMPRTARAQATKGSYVERSSLRVGDLMFFYVPGRFKSNKQVGHVGIYMGNQQMIHSSPLPEDGVQVTDINKDYWKDTFLYAKRVLD